MVTRVVAAGVVETGVAATGVAALGSVAKTTGWSRELGSWALVDTGSSVRMAQVVMHQRPGPSVISASGFSASALARLVARPMDQA